MFSAEDRKKYIKLINQEVKPALGCTEPIALALAVARSAEELGVKADKVVIELSANILKNGMGVGIPGTGMTGLNIAAALGVNCGKSSYGLEVLRDLNEENLAESKKFVDENRISISIADTKEKLYIKATCIAGDDSAVTIISGMHDNIIYVAKNNTVILDKKANTESKESSDNSGIIDTRSFGLTVKSIYEFATTAPYEEIKFILAAADMNRKLSVEGLTLNYGLQVGKSIRNDQQKSVFGDSLLTYAMSMTAAASDARMAGCTLPAMSNSGSGNQGIAVTLPVVAAADRLKSTDEELARALVISHLTAVHIKSYLGRLSALCGCVIAATGSSCGITYLMGGNYDNITYSIKNMIGNITGMVCDGAKVGCALKVATGVSSSVQSASLAVSGICISDNDGIIESSIENTIRNLGTVGSVGMQTTDNIILDIMINKDLDTPQCN